MPKYIQLDDNKISNLFIGQKKTYKQIASIFGVSEPTIKRRLRNLNVRRGPKYTITDDIFNSVNKWSCYWAGFIGADGWISKKKNTIRIELKSTDCEHLHKFCDFIGRERSSVRIYRRTKWEKEYKSAILEIGNANIVRGLVNNFNISTAKSFTLCSPELKSELYIKSYILGYFDGDGSVGFYNGIVKFNITSGSENIVRWIKDQIKIFTGTEVPQYKYNNVLILSTSGKKAMRILDWLYAGSTKDTRLQRKYERYKEYSKTR